MYYSNPHKPIYFENRMLTSVVHVEILLRGKCTYNASMPSLQTNRANQVKLTCQKLIICQMLICIWRCACGWSSFPLRFWSHLLYNKPRLMNSPGDKFVEFHTCPHAHDLSSARAVRALSPHIPLSKWLLAETLWSAQYMTNCEWCCRLIVLLYTGTLSPRVHCHLYTRGQMRFTALHSKCFTREQSHLFNLPRLFIW